MTKRIKIKRNDIELGIQAEIIGVLKVAGIPDLIWYAVPNGEYRDWQTSLKLRDAGVVSGVLDIALIDPRDGKAAFLEVKTTANTSTLSDEQIAFGARLDSIGVRWAVVRSRAEATVILRQWGLIQWPRAVAA